MYAQGDWATRIVGLIRRRRGAGGREGRVGEGEGEGEQTQGAAATVTATGWDGE